MSEEVVEKIDQVRYKDREGFGCVVRSLESALGVRATDKEWKLRLSQISGNTDRYKNELIRELSSDLFGAQIEEVDRHAIDRDKQGVIWLMQQMATYNTPLGKALRNCEIGEDQLNQEEIRSALQDNRKILIAAYAPGIGRHMAHLVIDPDGNIVSASDGNVRVRLKQDKKYEVIELAKREKVEQ